MLTDDQKLIAEVVASHWRAYRKRLRACRVQLSEDSVHKLRISLRRLLALIDLLLAIQAPGRKSKLRKQLKRQLSALSELRDLQVMRLETTIWVGEHPQLQAFLHHLHLRELALLSELPKLIAGWRSGKLKRKINRIARSDAHNHTEAFSHLLIGYLDGIFQQISSRQSQLDSSNLTTFHKLRITIKRLRYTLELAMTWLPNLPSQQLLLLKNYQELLGDIQNTEVLLFNLTTATAGQMPSTLEHGVLENRQRMLCEFQQLQQRQPLTDFWHHSTAELPDY